MTESAPRWGGVALVLAFVGARFASPLGFVLFALAQGIPASELDTDALTIGEVALLQVPLWLGLLGVPLVATRLRGNGPRRDLGLWMTLPDVPIGLAIGVACQLVLVPLVTLQIFIFTDTAQEALAAPARELTDKDEGPGERKDVGEGQREWDRGDRR